MQLLKRLSSGDMHTSDFRKMRPPADRLGAARPRSLNTQGGACDLLLAAGRVTSPLEWRISVTTVQNPASGKSYTWHSRAAAAVRAERVHVLGGHMAPTRSEVAADEAADARGVSSYPGRLLTCVHVRACSCVRGFLFQRLVMRPSNVMSVTRARCCLARLTSRAQRVRRRWAAVLHAPANFTLSCSTKRHPSRMKIHSVKNKCSCLRVRVLLLCVYVTTVVRMSK